MSNSIPKQNLPFRVVLHRVGEATLNQYKAAQTMMDSPLVAFDLWQEVIAEERTGCDIGARGGLVPVQLYERVHGITGFGESGPSSSKKRLLTVRATQPSQPAIATPFIAIAVGTFRAAVIIRWPGKLSVGAALTSKTNKE